jgi:hypothetical protein
MTTTTIQDTTTLPEPRIRRSIGPMAGSWLI